MSLSSSDSSVSSTSEHIHIDMNHEPELVRDHIIEEIQLHKYTDDHFINRLDVFNALHDYNQIDDDYNFKYAIESNSPIIMSNDNSDNSDCDYEYDPDYDCDLLFETSGKPSSISIWPSFIDESSNVHINELDYPPSGVTSGVTSASGPSASGPSASASASGPGPGPSASGLGPSASGLGPSASGLGPSASGPSASASGPSGACPRRLKKLTFREVSESINKYYETDDKYSNELDILTTFLKGQKNLYLKSRTITQLKLNLLMIPSFIGTSIITIFAPIIQGKHWSGAFISALNAIVTLLISIVHYFKLESSSEMYLNMTNQYDRMESSIEFASNKITFFENHKDKNHLVLSKMKEVEKKINEIKDSTSILIPIEVKQIFPIICNVNIFSFIKRIESYKKNLLVKFKDVKNEIRYIQWKWGAKIENKELARLDFLLKIKEKLKNEILHYKNAYGCIDELFMKEIKQAHNIGLFQIWFFDKKRRVDISENHALKDYFSTIFDNGLRS